MIFWPHIGLAGDFDVCEENLLSYINRNFQILDAVVQMGFEDFVTTLPDNADPGQVFILEDNPYTYAACVS